MQLAIELPDELGEQLMRQGNVSQFVQEAIRKMLSDTSKTHNADVSFSIENKTEHLPITRSLVGLLKNSQLDIKDYKQHLEDKYL
ncbi:MAG: hypothetical protein NTZ45_02345 [Methylococcales bacterium]|nr:hypothetical protein [Methylococcales bacterium]